MTLVWWYLPYDDPETGKHFDFEWEATIRSRTEGGYGCPYLSGQAVWPGFNDLQTKYPKVAREWHPTKNGTLGPDKVFYMSGQRVWWYLPYDDPETGKHFDFEWEATIRSRTEGGYGCPYLSGHVVWLGFNDLQTKYPEIAREWHPTRNGILKPANVTAGTNRKVWWYLPYDDPKTGKHFDFEWEANINSRTTGRMGCPYLSGQAVWPGFNDLQTKYPEIAREWHPTRNGTLIPDMVAANSNKIIWWYFPYDDPKTGKHFDFEWAASVCRRTAGGCGCPYLSGQAVWPGFNDLKSSFSWIALQWDLEKNKTDPSKIYNRSMRKYWWKCTYCGKRWIASVYSRTVLGSECPFCKGKDK